MIYGQFIYAQRIYAQPPEGQQECSLPATIVSSFIPEPVQGICASALEQARTRSDYSPNPVLPLLFSIESFSQLTAQGGAIAPFVFVVTSGAWISANGTPIFVATFSAHAQAALAAPAKHEGACKFSLDLTSSTFFIPYAICHEYFYEEALTQLFARGFPAPHIDLSGLIPKIVLRGELKMARIHGKVIERVPLLGRAVLN